MEKMGGDNDEPCGTIELSLTRAVHAPTIQPMYILTRYVVWEVLKFFLAALVVLTLFVTMVMGVKVGLDKGAPPVVMLRIMPYMLPEMLGITIPVAMLFSVSSVFGRMTGANEIVAVKSLGISPMVVVWPALVLACFLSLGTVWMYEIAATWCRPNREGVLAESIEEIAISMLQKNNRFDCDLFSVNVKRVVKPAEEGGKPRLILPTITIKGQAGQPRVTLTADAATFSTDGKARLLRITVINSEVDYEGVSLKYPGEYTYPVEIPMPARQPYHRDWVAMREIPPFVDALRAKLRALEDLRKARKALGQPDSPQENNDIDEVNIKISRLRTEPYRRWANGFSCLFFALIGAPVAMLRRHADVLTNFFFCFLPILVVYYPLLMFGEDLSTSGKLPPVAFWMANTVLIFPAVILMRRIIRH